MINYRELEEIEESLSEAKGQLAELTHWRKIVLAEQQLKAQDGGAKSVAAADMIARDSKPYRDAVYAYAKIVEKESRLWFKYKRLSRQLGVM